MSITSHPIMEICHLSFLNSFYFKAVPSTRKSWRWRRYGLLHYVRNGHGLVGDLGNESIRLYFGLGDRSAEALTLLSHLSLWNLDSTIEAAGDYPGWDSQIAWPRAKQNISRDRE